MRIKNIKKLTAMLIIITVMFSYTCIVSASTEPYLGEIQLFAFRFPPKGWAICNGQLLPINQNQALFSLLGNQYGGDGTVNFALPDLTANPIDDNDMSWGAPWGKYAGGYYCIALQGIFPSKN